MSGKGSATRTLAFAPCIRFPFGPPSETEWAGGRGTWREGRQVQGTWESGWSPISSPAALTLHRDQAETPPTTALQRGEGQLGQRQQMNAAIHSQAREQGWNSVASQIPAILLSHFTLLSRVGQGALRWNRRQKHTAVPPYLCGIRSKTPSGCLKQWKYQTLSMLYFSIYTYLW